MLLTVSGGIVLDPNEKVAAGGGGGSGSERSDSLPSYDPDVDAGSSLSSHTSQVSPVESLVRRYGNLFLCSPFFFLFFYNYVIFLQAQAFVQVCDSLHPFSFQVSFGHGENRNRKFGRQTSAMACSDHKVFVVWLESFDDCYTFPASK